jgi:hypothetical protein
MTDGLVEWLRAQLDEDERLAREATVDVPAEPDASGVWPGWPWSPGDTSGLPWVQHCMRHDPARVLAEVQSKRLILEAAVDAASRRLYYERDGEEPFAAESVGFDEAMTKVLRLLALPYQDRPGYLEQWRP